jgi:serine phosphatase RsbU (regulator of sigma subunit)
VALAGHPAPLVAAGRVAPVQATPGPPLGVLPEPSWYETTVELPERFSLVLYTDGLVEGRVQPGSGRRFGIERLCSALERHEGNLDDAALDAVLAEAQQANGGQLVDDVAIMVVASADG